MTRNKIEIRVCGLQRSGNHALINWVLKQYNGSSICFLNNVRHGNCSPFDHASQIFVYNLGDLPNGRLREIPDNLAAMQKDVLIYSYEDDRHCLEENRSLLEGFYSEEFFQNRLHYIGESDRTIEAIIVRDPYNFFASRLKKLNQLTGIKDVDQIIASWKELAKEAITIQEKSNPSRMVFNYNQWFKSKAYRQQLCQDLGGQFNDNATKEVSSIGGGSSFDKTDFDGSLQLQDLFRKWRKLLQPATYTKLGHYWKKFQGGRQMKVLERWKSIDDPQMQKVFDDPEIAELSKQLFGEILKPQG